MNAERLRAKSLKRFIRSSRIVEASADDILNQAIAMSPHDRDKYIFEFLSEHGLKGAINVIANITKLFKSMNVPEPGEQHEVEQAIKNEKPVTAQMYEGFKKPQAEEKPEQGEDTMAPGKTDIKTVLNKLGDWGVLLTFFCMLGAAGTSDYEGLVRRSPKSSEEIKAFLVFSGA